MECVKTTTVYVTLMPDELAEAVSVFDAGIGGSGGQLTGRFWRRPTTGGGLLPDDDRI